MAGKRPPRRDPPGPGGPPGRRTPIDPAPIAPAPRAAPDEAGRPVGDRAGIALLGLSGVLCGVLECLLIPLYLGASRFPLAVLLAVLSNVILVRLARHLAGSTAGLAVPFLGWLLAAGSLALVTRPEGDVIIPGGALQNVSYGVLFGGALSGAVTVAVSLPGRRG